MVTPSELEALVEADAPFTVYLHHESGDKIAEPGWPDEEVRPGLYRVSVTFRPHSGLWVASCIHDTHNQHINGRRQRMSLGDREFVTITAHVPW